MAGRANRRACKAYHCMPLATVPPLGVTATSNSLGLAGSARRALERAERRADTSSALRPFSVSAESLAANLAALASSFAAALALTSSSRAAAAMASSSGVFGVFSSTAAALRAAIFAAFSSFAATSSGVSSARAAAFFAAAFAAFSASFAAISSAVNSFFAAALRGFFSATASSDSAAASAIGRSVEFRVWQRTRRTSRAVEALGNAKARIATWLPIAPSTTIGLLRVTNLLIKWKRRKC